MALIILIFVRRFIHSVNTRLHCAALYSGVGLIFSFLLIAMLIFEAVNVSRLFIAIAPSDLGSTMHFPISEDL